MAVSYHTRNGKVRKHTNHTFGSHVNGICCGRKKEFAPLKQFKGGKRK